MCKKTKIATVEDLTSMVFEYRMQVIEAKMRLHVIEGELDEVERLIENLSEVKCLEEKIPNALKRMLDYFDRISNDLDMHTPHTFKLEELTEKFLMKAD
jgi:hypothetical protein